MRADAGPPAAWPGLLTCFLPFAAGYLISFLFRNVNAVAGPLLAAELELDAAALGTLTSAYFVAFAAAQIPLGVILDRYGPRRVDAALLLSAAAGACIFALAQDAAQLTVGRALIGLGVSACLMASFKANVLFWPPQRMAFANGILLAFGGIGAAAATVPVQWLIAAIGWRSLFLGLAGMVLAASAYIWFAVPERAGGAETSWREQIAGIRRVMTARVFWTVVPATVAAQGSFLSYQGLWAGPWLREVAGFDAALTAQVLLFMGLAMIPGFALSGLLLDWLGRRGVSERTVVAAYLGAFLAVQVPLAFNVTQGCVALWVLFALLGTGASAPFALLTRRFPPALAGRVNTGLNLLIFVGAFATQAGIGWIVSLFAPPGAAFAPAGFRAAFLAVIGLQALAWLWLVLRPYAPRGHPLA